MKGGILFEHAFNEALRSVGCIAVTCERWDKEEKTDVLVTCVDGRRLRVPAELQVTLQRDSFLKLKSYLACVDGRAAGERRRSVYVEVGEGVQPSVAAAAVKRLLVILSDDGHSAGPFGLRVHAQGEERFDPRERCAKLALRASPEHTAHMRVSGAIIEVQSHGFLIATHDCGLFWAYDGDIADGRLRAVIRDARAGHRSAFGRGVSLIPDGMSRQHGRATSVICARATAKGRSASP